VLFGGLVYNFLSQFATKTNFGLVWPEETAQIGTPLFIDWLG
jgi:hypothetical protein